MKRGNQAKRKRNSITGTLSAIRHVPVGMLLFLCLPPFLKAQQTDPRLIDFTYKTYDLEKNEDNVIQNAAHLDDFFEGLYQLKNNGDRIITIVHIGDSHIQADYLTRIVRRNFQQHFGNAGRGLIVPAKVAGTNEPPNFISSSNIRWNSKRLIFPAQPLPIGVGGITLQTDRPGAHITMYMNDLWQDYSSNAVTLFFQKDISSFDFSVQDTARHELGRISSFASDPFVDYSRLLLPRPVSAFVIETVQSSPKQKQATLFGINLENGSNGVLYHAIGVNGAQYEHYNAALYFARQTTALRPDLFVISLGTNEALNYPYLDKNFYSEVDKLIASLRSNNPDARFILVTPPDSFRKKIKPNPGIASIREQILQYAVENGLAFWDMHKVLGGPGSAAAWRGAGLLRSDGIHFTKDAYEYQGNLFYAAMIKAYNQYVPDRHP